MNSVRFRFATDILRRLGEELNPSLDQSVIELVKNAHDADATRCEVRLESVAEPGGTLTVSDNGAGMSATDVAEHFLLLGRSPKTGNRMTPGGRTLAGSKGLGRLAALRAGHEVVVQTTSSKMPNEEHELRIDWSDFDEAATVDSVPLEISTHTSDSPQPHGTTIEVRRLRRQIGRREVRRLARSLLLLADPYDDTPASFRPTLDSPEFKDLEELVRKKYFDSAEYHLEATVDENGLGSARVTDWKGELLFEAAHGDLQRSREPYECPAAQLDVWIFILNAKTFETRNASVGEVREWLQEFGGVMLYLNGIRVPPYGDANNDWLDMNLRRTQSPEERPSTNTSLGRLRVLDAGLLESKTDRSGLIESQAFLDLRRFAQDSLDWMARERLRVAESRRRSERKEAPTQTTTTKTEVHEAIEKAGPAAPGLKKAFSRYDRAREREARTLRDEVQLYRTLSTAGITAATFAHEASGGPLKVIGRAVSTVRRRVKAVMSSIPSDVEEPLDRIKASAASLGAFSDTTLDLVDRDKRRTGRVEVHTVLIEVVKTYEPFVEARETTVELHLAPGTPYLRGSVAAMESIVVNLLTNALTALAQSADETRKIEIATSILGETIEIVVCDNGPGIEGFSESEIWLPGVTSRPGGSGLGLTIVRDTVSDLGGDVSAKPIGKLGGAEFTVHLPILGA